MEKVSKFHLGQRVRVYPMCYDAGKVGTITKITAPEEISCIAEYYLYHVELDDTPGFSTFFSTYQLEEY
jgi:hypothetical protein